MTEERQPLPGAEKRVGATAISVADVGGMPVTRERMEPGWRWSVDLKPVVGTPLCQAVHQMYLLSGRLALQLSDGSEIELGPGDSMVVPPDHDAWVVGDEPCEIIDLSSDYANLIDAGEAYLAVIRSRAESVPRSEIASRLREQVERGELESSAVELILGAVGLKTGRRRGPAGLTPRECEVLTLIATGAAAKQVASALGITLKTATTHIERIYTKCGVSSRAEATHFAISHGLVKTLR